eukprot:c1897_g1_i1.p1 GENE.c1897_g1_i1~~c1897_g1_i1.p1  ORF type:complete len:679 (-),score=152.43 c1897_g1_i1:41-2077(-)
MGTFRLYDEFPLMQAFLVYLQVFSKVFVEAPPKLYCRFGEPCWPSSEEILELKNSLDPQNPRIFKFDIETQPPNSPTVEGTPDFQALYGLGVDGLQAVYTRPTQGLTCGNPDALESSEEMQFCASTTRNVPYENWTPGIVVFPLTVEHIQLAVRFAVEHNMCIMVAGTGHDFQNRHSCEDGFFIRTNFFKSIEFDLDDKKDFGHSEGNVKFGAGVVWAEAHTAVAKVGRYIASGWSPTVGVIGWSIGGGRGPFTPSKGYGVDNILEADIVIANGDLLTVNRKHHSDLFWALLGGGGSTWGVITSITVRTHLTPKEGMSYIRATFGASLCEDGIAGLQLFLSAAQNFILNLDIRFGGYFNFNTARSEEVGGCGGYWYSVFSTAYLGSVDEATQALESFGYEPVEFEVSPLSNWAEFIKAAKTDYITPTTSWAPSDVLTGGITSVVVPREGIESGAVFERVFQQLLKCTQTPTGVCYSAEQVFFDMTGYEGSPNSRNNAISDGFRNAMVLYISLAFKSELNQFYALGQNSYFSESAYEMDNWQNRYWGNKFQRLMSVKQKYDPTEVFWCRHCVRPGVPACADHNRQVSEFGRSLGLRIDCSILGSADLCDDPQFSSLLQLYCPVTCNVVDDDQTIQAVATSVGLTYESCEEVLHIIDCKDPTYGQFLKRFCPCSCNSARF